MSPRTHFVLSLHLLVLVFSTLALLVTATNTHAASIEYDNGAASSTATAARA